MVETVTLAAVGFVGLCAPAPDGSARGRRHGPRRRARGGRSRAGAFGRSPPRAGRSRVLLLLPHATLILVSLVPRNTWTTETLPPVLDLAQLRGLFREPERLRPIVNSLWMAAAATAAALLLGFFAAAAAVRGRRSGRFALGNALERLIAAPWALPGTVFAVALAAAFCVHAPWAGALRPRRDRGDPAARLSRAEPAAHRPRRVRRTSPAGSGARGSRRLSRGAAPGGALARIVLPHLRPALLAGASLAFLTALGDFVVSIVLYTYSTRPISIEILSSLRLQEIGVAAAYGVLLTALSAAAFLAWGRRA